MWTYSHHLWHRSSFGESILWDFEAKQSLQSLFNGFATNIRALGLFGFHNKYVENNKVQYKHRALSMYIKINILC